MLHADDQGVDPDGEAFEPGPGGDAGQRLDRVLRQGFLDDELNPRQHEQKSRDERGWLGDGASGFTQSKWSFEHGGNGHKGFFSGRAVAGWGAGWGDGLTVMLSMITMIA